MAERTDEHWYDTSKLAGEPLPFGYEKHDHVRRTVRRGRVIAVGHDVVTVEWDGPATSEEG